MVGVAREPDANQPLGSHWRQEDMTISCLLHFLKPKITKKDAPFRASFVFLNITNYRTGTGFIALPSSSAARSKHWRPASCSQLP